MPRTGTLPEANVRRERPVITGTEDPDIAAARGNPECIEEAVVIVRRTVALMNGNVELVGAFDQIQAVDNKCHVRLAGQLMRLPLFQFGVGSKATHAVRIEEADSKYEVAGRLGGTDTQPDRHRVACVKHEGRLARLTEQGNLD